MTEDDTKIINDVIFSPDFRIAPQKYVWFVTPNQQTKIMADPKLRKLFGVDMYAGSQMTIEAEKDG